MWHTCSSFRTVEQDRPHLTLQLEKVPGGSPHENHAECTCANTHFGATPITSSIVRSGRKWKRACAQLRASRHRKYRNHIGSLSLRLLHLIGDAAARERIYVRGKWKRNNAQPRQTRRCKYHKHVRSLQIGEYFLNTEGVAPAPILVLFKKRSTAQMCRLRE